MKDMAKTLSAEISLPVPHPGAAISDHIPKQTETEKEDETVGIQLRGGTMAQDSIAEISRPTPQPPSSPPLPTSPPLLIHEFNRLNLKEMTKPSFPLDKTLPDCIDASATCRSKDRITGELAEGAGRVRAKC